MALPSLDNTADDQTQIAIDVLGKAIMEVRQEIKDL